MGAQPSSVGSGAAAAGSSSPLRNLGSAKAASFAPTPEPIGAPSRRSKTGWVRPPWQTTLQPTADLEAGRPDQDLGMLFSSQASDMDLVPEPTMERRPSKRSVDSSFSAWEGTEPSRPASASSKASSLRYADSRPASSQGFDNYSRSSSFAGPRPASASSKLGAMKAPGRDPRLLQAEKLAKLSLETLEQQDFITAKEAWGAVPTPSTVSPTNSTNLSRAASSVSSSACGSRPATSASSASASSSNHGNDPLVKLQLKEARQRAKASFAALQSELQGASRSTPARYSSWPVGCAVRVAFEDPMTSALEPDSLIAILVKYDGSLNTFEVSLSDGSTRTVPARCVTRARAADRAHAPSTFVGKSPSSARTLDTKPVI